MAIKILIADDSFEIRDSLKAVFSQTDILVAAEACTGNEAVCLAREVPVDVVLLDIAMPGGNGFEALHRIKSENPELAVVMHSTFDSTTYKERSHDLGASGYVVKDGNVHCLMDTLRGAVKRSVPTLR